MGKIKVFLDTNVVVDYFTSRMRDGIAARIVQAGQTPSYELCISFLTAINTIYVSTKYGNVLSPDVLCRLFTVLPQTKEQWLLATDLNYSDFEDAAQQACAIDAQCNIIITRDKRHFADSIIKVYSPEEFLKKIDVE